MLKEHDCTNKRRTCLLVASALQLDLFKLSMMRTRVKIMKTCICLAMLFVISMAQDDALSEALTKIKSSAEITLEQIESRSDTPRGFKVLFNSMMFSARPCQTAEFERFRRIDGVCNNLEYPFRGAIMTYERRLFENNYLDGKKFPRDRDNEGNLLPSARKVSIEVFGQQEDGEATTEPTASQITWQFSQYLSHDVTLIGDSGGSDCCGTADSCDDISCQHKDLYEREGGCFPIALPSDDPHYDERCMPFSRSYGINVNDKREIVNGITAFIDSSSTYGSSVFHMNQLRLGAFGQLKTTANGQLLPNLGKFPCVKPDTQEFCPASGDVRVSAVPGLNAMHTLFHRTHNLIASKLFYSNLFWDDERTFQETRKIIGGVLQKIVYEDFLPMLLGEDVMRVFDIDKEYIYDSTVDPSAILEYTTAGFRAGHSQITTTTLSKKLSDLYFRRIDDDPHTPLDILVDQAQKFSQDADNLFTNEVRGLLFKDLPIPGMNPSPLPGLDLVALNIQRGRDHGLPPYVDVRDTCRGLLSGLDGVVQELPDTFSVYNSERDIDLYAGAMSEKPLPGALLGPTNNCMTALQFQALKFGDRFFYEGSGIEGFTEEQRKFIRRMTLSAMLCLHDGTIEIQRNAFRPANDETNEVVNCSDILAELKLDEGLAFWKDNSNELTIKRLFMNLDLQRNNELEIVS